MYKHYLVAMRWAGCDLSGEKQNSKKKGGEEECHLTSPRKSTVDRFACLEMARFPRWKLPGVAPVMMLVSITQTSLHSAVLYAESS